MWLPWTYHIPMLPSRRKAKLGKAPPAKSGKEMPSGYSASYSVSYCVSAVFVTVLVTVGIPLKSIAFISYYDRAMSIAQT